MQSRLNYTLKNSAINKNLGYAKKQKYREGKSVDHIFHHRPGLVWHYGVSLGMGNVFAS